MHLMHAKIQAIAKSEKPKPKQKGTLIMKQAIIVESRIRAWTKVEPRPKTKVKNN